MFYQTLVSLPAKSFKIYRKPNEISWTTNSGTFVTKYDIPLTFSLIYFAPSREIEWVAAIDENNSQFCCKIIVRQDFQQAILLKSMTEMG
jgi:hypothetical protein